VSAVETPLFERAQAGDRQAFSALVTAHRDAVYRYALRLTNDPAFAEDTLQETFITALQHMPEARGEASFRGWLLSIARSRVLHDRRRRVGEPTSFAPEAELMQLGLEAGWGETMDPEALAARTEAQQVLDHALAQLDHEAREVLLLRDVEGLSGEETARVLGLALPAMKSRLHRARLRLLAAVKGAADGHE
jgi:RNA polymerase sigma-70 factor, ECF subfamily